MVITIVARTLVDYFAESLWEDYWRLCAAREG